LVGTVDPTAWLCIPSAIRFLDSLFPSGLAGLREHNRALALEGQKMLCDALSVPLPAPLEMIGSLATLPLPDRPANEKPIIGNAFIDPLGTRLLENHRIEVPIFAWPAREKRNVRIAAQAYVQRAEIEALCDALREELAAE
jgi:isopenicillin-N epimerase